jgi:hypothetical protein
MEITKALLANQANMEHRDKRGFTPLLAAANLGFSSVVNSMLSAGSNIRAADLCGRTCLHVASEHNNLRMGRALLNIWPQMHMMRDKQGRSSSDLAISNEFRAMIKSMGQADGHNQPHNATARLPPLTTHHSRYASEHHCKYRPSTVCGKIGAAGHQKLPCTAAAAKLTVCRR